MQTNSAAGMYCMCVCACMRERERKKWLKKLQISQSVVVNIVFLVRFVRQSPSWPGRKKGENERTHVFTKHPAVTTSAFVFAFDVNRNLWSFPTNVSELSQLRQKFPNTVRSGTHPLVFSAQTINYQIPDHLRSTVRSRGAAGQPPNRC